MPGSARYLATSPYYKGNENPCGLCLDCHGKLVSIAPYFYVCEDCKAARGLSSIRSPGDPGFTACKTGNITISPVKRRSRRTLKNRPSPAKGVAKNNPAKNPRNPDVGFS